jgi:hypothetical protein
MLKAEAFQATIIAWSVVATFSDVLGLLSYRYSRDSRSLEAALSRFYCDNCQ